MTNRTDAELLEAATQFIEEANPAYPVELYDLVYELACRLVERHENETPEVQHTRLAVEELSDRLSDAISECVELSVQLRARDENIVKDNEQAAKKFMDGVLGDIFINKPNFLKDPK